MEIAAEQPVVIQSGSLHLEGRLDLPAEPRGAVVVCHPHPEYGGSMDVPVVFTIASRLRREGFASLRFNFRGVGASEGGYGNMVGEVDDALAAVAFLAERGGAAEVDLVGYSFGAIVALHVAARGAPVRRVAVVAPPTAMMPIDFLAGCRIPVLVVAGDADSYTPAAEAGRAFAALGVPHRVSTLEGADHFLFGFEDEVAERIADFLFKEAT